MDIPDNSVNVADNYVDHRLGPLRLSDGISDSVTDELSETSSLVVQRVIEGDSLTGALEASRELVESQQVAVTTIAIEALIVALVRKAQVGSELTDDQRRLLRKVKQIKNRRRARLPVRIYS